MRIRNQLLKLYSLCYTSKFHNNYKLRRKYVLWLATNIGYRTIYLLFVIYLSVYRFLRLYPTPLNADGKFIVSLTSFPARIGKVWIVIDSLMRQTVRPSKICLYLSDEEFPNGRACLPRRLLNYERLGLEICFRPYNLMPHNKYFYALQEYSFCDVITVDDDWYYCPDVIERLTCMHAIHPNCICSNAVQIVSYRPDGLPLPYNKWPWPMNQANPSFANVALGYSGVYYPVGIFKSKSVFDMDDIRLLALRTDDLWLRMHETLERIPVVGGGYRYMGLQIPGSQRIALKHGNIYDEENNGNDIAWKKLCNHYNVTCNIM